MHRSGKEGLSVFLRLIGPSCRYAHLGDLLALLGAEFRRLSGSALLAAESAQGDRCGVLGFASKLTETKESAGSSAGSNNLNVDRIGDVYKSVTFTNIGEFKFAKFSVISLGYFIISNSYDNLNNNSQKYNLKELSGPKVKDERSPVSDEKFDGD